METSRTHQFLPVVLSYSKTGSWMDDYILTWLYSESYFFKRLPSSYCFIVENVSLNVYFYVSSKLKVSVLADQRQ